MLPSHYYLREPPSISGTSVRVPWLSVMPCMQALLDVYTIQRELGRLDNLRVGLVGDLANGRTVRSLAYLLSMYSGIKFYFVAPDVVRMQVCQEFRIHPT